jgi:peptidyl-prolyl cis-trans isomerase D
MLDFMRKNASSMAVKIILGAIALVFVFWGIGTFRSQRVTSLATVNGEDIHYEEYRMEYINTIERYKQLFSGQMPEGFLEKMNIKGQVLDNLINNLLMKEAASKLNIYLSDEEIQEEILKIPAFLSNGKFDKNLYERALRANRMTPADFEKKVHQQLLFEKISNLLTNSITIPESEAKEQYEYENEMRELAYLTINPDTFTKEITLKDDELQSYYEANKEKYRTAPKIALNYIEIKKTDVSNTINISDEDARLYYEEHQSDYEAKEQRHAHHILIKTDKNADESTVAAARKKAEDLLSRLKKGESFEEVAKKYSDDQGSAQRGGDLGLFGRGMMVKPFEDAVFSMQPGELSGLVKTDFGWHIIRLDEIRPSGLRPFDEVKDTIIARLKDERSKSALFEQASKLYDAIIAQGSLTLYAQKNGVALAKTGLFSKNTPPPHLLTKEAMNELFELGQGSLSSIIETPDGMLVAEIAEKVPSAIPTFDEVKAQVTLDLGKQKATEAAGKKAEELISALKGKDIHAVAKEKGLNLLISKPYSRSNMATLSKEIPPPVLDAGLSLTQSKPLTEKPVEANGVFYVVSLKTIINADMAGFPAQQKAITDKLLMQKKGLVMDSWLKDLRKKAKITIHKEQL